MEIACFPVGPRNPLKSGMLRSFVRLASGMVQKRFKIYLMTWEIRLRMVRAQELLILHGVPQSVIGELVGYRSEFAFLGAFKRFSGVTPGEFRKRR